MDLKQIMIVFALLLGLILSATVGVVYGQTPTPTPKTQPQSVQEQQQLTQNILPPGGKCLGLQTSPTYCKFIQMPDVSMILNTQWTENAFTISADVLYAGDPYVGSTQPGSSKEDTQTVELPPWCEGLTLSRCPPLGKASGSRDQTQNEQTITWTDPKTGLVYDIPAKGYYCLDFDEDSICDVDFEDGKMVLYGESESDQETVEEDEVEDETGGNGNDNPQDDPDCWYGDIYVCDENGECDTDRIDCITDCEDGSSVTTGEECPGDDDSDEPANEETDESDDSEEKTAAEFDREHLGLEEGDASDWANTETHCSEAESGEECWELDD